MKKAILVSCFDWYEKRLEPIVTLLSNKGYEVSVYTSDFNHVTKERISDKSNKQNYLHVRQYKKNLSLSRILSHLSFSKQIKKILFKEKPDLVYCLIPVNSLAKVCALYKKKNNRCKLIFDIIDMWPESMPINRFRNTPPYKLWRNYRDKNIPMADYLVTECDLYYSYLKQFINEDKHSTVYLYKKYDENIEKYINSSIEKYEHKDNSLSLCYLGSINHIIDIDSIVNTIKTLTKLYKIDLHIVGDGEGKSELIESAEKAGAKVIYHGKIFDEKEKIDIISKCDFGINMMKKNVMVGLTIKSIDYFCYGLPIINNIKVDTKSLVDRYGIGINIEQVKDLIVGKHLLSAKKHQEVHNLFLQYFSLDSYKKKLSEVFENVDKE